VSTAKAPDDPIGKAITLLRKGPSAPSDDEIRKWIEELLHLALLCQSAEELDTEYESAALQVNKTAKAMQRAFEALHSVEHKSGCLRGHSPIEDLERFEESVGVLASWDGLKPEGVQEIYWVLRNGFGGNTHAFSDLLLSKQIFRIAKSRPRKTKPKLPLAILMLHCAAVEMLKRCGMAPTGGSSVNVRDSSANVARLGELLCTVAGFPGGESTRAARLACSPLADAGIAMGELLPKPRRRKNNTSDAK
jgi:hypothetical protein